MNGSNLKTILGQLEITQADFARLVGVTPRAVALWAADERAIPGPAEAYLRLLESLPQNLLQVELRKLKTRGSNMRDGMYGIRFQSGNSFGMGVLILENGRVYGADSEAVRYDGEYIYDEATGLADVQAKVTFPPNVKAVFGVSNPYEWAFDITTRINPMQKSGGVLVKTSLGQTINAQFVFLRDLPNTV